jgi:heterodisulfide reductase subunit B2
MAQDAGAQCMVVACPMCQTSLDLRQGDMEKLLGKQYNMPVLYITQLLGLALGLSPNELGLDKLMCSPTVVLNALKAGV